MVDLMEEVALGLDGILLLTHQVEEAEELPISA
jgi:hypothetical protein